MLIALIPIIFVIIGILMYFVSANAKVQELGRLTFAVAMLALMLEYAHHMVHLG